MLTTRASPKLTNGRVCSRSLLGTARLASSAHGRSGSIVRAVTEVEHIQLATARLPGGIDQGVFAEQMYQWAATLTQSGRNLPFALPLKADRLETGFQIALLKRTDNRTFGSAADIVGTVEDIADVGPVLFVRFFEGPAAFLDRRTPAPVEPQERLDILLQSLVDVNLIMQTMSGAIRKAAALAVQQGSTSG